MKQLLSIKTLASLSVVLIISSACKNDTKEELVDKFVDCARALEDCKNRCAPTQRQLDQIATCYGDCFTGGLGENAPPPGSPLECQTFCENLVYGNNTPERCEERCEEQFYECFLGEDWEEVVNN